jgi:hypothetical protein
MRTPEVRNERGVALAMAVFALVVIGALVAGTFMAGRLEQTGGRNSIHQAQAFEAAEAGLATTIANWDPDWNDLAIGDSLVLGSTSIGGSVAPGVYYQPTIVRTGEQNFLVRSTGTRTLGSGTLAQRSVGQLTKLIFADVPIRAALTARGDLEVRGTADLYGANADPPDWNTETEEREACPYDPTTVPSAEVSGAIYVSGTPTMLPPPIDSSLAVDDTAMYLGPYNDLVEMATLVLGSSTLSPVPVASTDSIPVCRIDITSNWGEPGSDVVACKDYFPIIYRPGNLRLQNGRGQGILLVDGDLELAGNFTFAGIIMTRGAFRASHGTNDVYGTVLAANATLDDINLAGTPQVQFSTCAISRALQRSGKAKPLVERAWAQLY